MRALVLLSLVATAYAPAVAILGEVNDVDHPPAADASATAPSCSGRRRSGALEGTAAATTVADAGALPSAPVFCLLLG